MDSEYMYESIKNKVIVLITRVIPVFMESIGSRSAKRGLLPHENHPTLYTRIPAERERSRPKDV
eukprot:2529962-Prymnesium_polylepis.1